VVCVRNLKTFWAADGRRWRYSVFVETDLGWSDRYCAEQHMPVKLLTHAERAAQATGDGANWGRHVRPPVGR